jgi:hypothetical protein
MAYKLGLVSAAMRHDRIIVLLGGNRTLGRLLDRSESAVSRWRDNGIPPSFLPDIVRMAQKLGKEEITFDALVNGSRTRVGNRSKGRAAERVA